MNKKSYSFPSVFEATSMELNAVSDDLLNGIEIFDEENQAYIIGNLALTEGSSPHKAINSSPRELDYNLFLKAGILLATHKNNRPLTITTGFPFSTYQIYKDLASESIRNLEKIDYNPKTFSEEERARIKANIQNVEVLPEMIGNIIALRVGEQAKEGNFFVVSLGYGTCEAVLSTESGIVHRTSVSINGMQYAVEMLMRALSTKYYLGFKTEKHIDMLFRNDYIILDRKRINIVEVRKAVLQRYYKEVVSPVLRKSFRDADFEIANRIYLTGGGALYPELVEEFNKEFNDIAAVEVVNNPLTLTSEGYSFNSIMLAEGDKSNAIGLDIGNANTVLTQYEKEIKTDFEPSFS